MVKIRLKRMGSKRRPFYRIVVMDARTARDGRPIEELGYYHPVMGEENQVSIKSDRVEEWLHKGAQATDTVRSILNSQGIHCKRS